MFFYCNRALQFFGDDNEDNIRQQRRVMVNGLTRKNIGRPRCHCN